MGSFVYRILKYVFYLCNLIILLAGAALILIGVYARLNTSFIAGDLTAQLFNPGNYVIAFGVLLLIFGLLGAVVMASHGVMYDQSELKSHGSVREVAVLLGIYAGAIVLMIVLEVALVLFIFLGKEKVKELANDGIITLIENYRTFSDLRIIIDLVQTSLSCCGGYESINDWENNLYFNCSSLAISACGVPTSCCREELQINSQCGYYIRSPNDTSRLGNVNTLGCIAAIENIFNHELNILIGCLTALFIIEIIVIAIALWLLVDRQKKKNLRVINHTGLEDSNRVRESDWEINSI